MSKALGVTLPTSRGPNLKNEPIFLRIVNHLCNFLNSSLILTPRQQHAIILLTNYFLLMHADAGPHLGLLEAPATRHL